MAKTSYAIALGSNRRHGRHGAPKSVIEAAIAALDKGKLKLVARSSIHATPALGPAGRSFANAVAIVATKLDPPALLRHLKKVERDFGRRRGRRWGPRVLDLDIILSSGGTWPRYPNFVPAGRLRIPHRDFARRGFVLAPLVEIAPDWCDPVSGYTVRQLAHRLTAARPLHR
jgi:2-amino-4-hydroxy-6-hydroxymethyldihydropteridine diphosphokinase